MICSHYDPHTHNDWVYTHVGNWFCILISDRKVCMASFGFNPARRLLVWWQWAWRHGSMGTAKRIYRKLLLHLFCNAAGVVSMMIDRTGSACGETRVQWYPACHQLGSWLCQIMLHVILTRLGTRLARVAEPKTCKEPEFSHQQVDYDQGRLQPNVQPLKKPNCDSPGIHSCSTFKSTCIFNRNPQKRTSRTYLERSAASGSPFTHFTAIKSSRFRGLWNWNSQLLPKTACLKVPKWSI